jgi:hypothetical protein
VANPFRSEADAYRFVWLTIGYCGLIVAASFINRWLGVAVFVLLTIAAVWFFLRGRRERPVGVGAIPSRSADGERRILVVANETVGGNALCEAIHERAEQYRENVLVVCPALNSPLRQWASDEDPARAAAQERLERSLARLRELGVEARGEIGDTEPLQAIEDAMRTFGPDEVIISTHPEGKSHWLEKGIVATARERFDVPITHIVVDLENETEEIR